MSNETMFAPVPCPMTVTDFGFPPKLEMFSWIHNRAAVASRRPKLPVEDSEAFTKHSAMSSAKN